MGSSRSYLVILFLVLMTWAAFWPVQNHDFVNYDDDRYILQNPHLQEGFSWEGIRWAFSADLFYDSPNADYWQPVTFLSRMLDVELFGMNPAGHHSMNLILHILNVLLVFTLFKEMTGALWRSAFVAGLFAVHPLQVEAVAWVTARKDLLSTFFGLLTIGAYRYFVQKPSAGRNLGVVFLFLMSLMSKPALVTLPLLLLLLDFWPLKRGELKLFEKWPLFVVSVLFSLIPFIVQKEALGYAALPVVLSKIPIHYVGHIVKVFYPVQFVINSTIPDASFHLWPTGATALLLIAFTVLLILKLKSHPYFFFGWFWFLVTLIPTIGLLRFENRFMYLPIVGLAVLLAWSVSDSLVSRRQVRVALAFFVGILFSFLIPSTFAETGHWKNSVTLFEHALRVNPINGIAHTQLCAVFSDQGELEKAVVHCLEAIKIEPRLSRAHYNLGLAFTRQGKLDQAAASYTRAIQIDPSYFQAHSNLGVVLVRQGKWGEANSEFIKALHLKPDSAETHNNLALTLMKQGKREEAIRHYLEAVRLKPDYFDAQSNLGVALTEKSQWEEAVFHFKDALRLRPEEPYLHYNLGMTLAHQGKRKQAARHFIAAERLKA